MEVGKIYSIGHGGRTAEALVQSLRDAGVEFVIDVRSAPYSRHQPEFSREPLEALLAGNGLRYVFMGRELGGRPDDPDCYVEGRVDYARCREREAFRHGIGRLRKALALAHRVCLLCSEGDPAQCHRSKLIGAVLAEAGIEVQHVMPSGEVKTQTELMRELTGGQQSLFGEAFGSRKRYR